MIVVHHLNDSRSQRVLWLLEELGLPYEVKRYERDPATKLAPPSLRAVHPLGKSPVIADGERVIAETGAIVEYLTGLVADTALVPSAGTEERLRYTYWLHFAEGSAMFPLVLGYIMSEAPKRAPALLRPLVRGFTGGIEAQVVRPRVNEQLEFIERELGDRTWFAGDAFTAADIMMSFPLETAAARMSGAGSRPRIRDVLDRMRARPAYGRALARGGPYAYAAS